MFYYPFVGAIGTLWLVEIGTPKFSEPNAYIPMLLEYWEVWSCGFLLKGYDRSVFRSGGFAFVDSISLIVFKFDSRILIDSA